MKKFRLLALLCSSLFAQNFLATNNNDFINEDMKNTSEESDNKVDDSYKGYLSFEYSARKELDGKVVKDIDKRVNFPSESVYNAIQNIRKIVFGSIQSNKVSDEVLKENSDQKIDMSSNKDCDTNYTEHCNTTCDDMEREETYRGSTNATIRGPKYDMNIGLKRREYDMTMYDWRDEIKGGFKTIFCTGLGGVLTCSGTVLFCAYSLLGGCYNIFKGFFDLGKVGCAKAKDVFKNSNN